MVAKIYGGHSAHRHWRREKNGCKALLDAGITSPDLLYAGTLANGAPVLIFERLPTPCTALDHWLQAKSDDQRLEVLVPLVTLVAKGHRKGLLQSDLHLENFLFSQGTLYAIDGDGIRYSRKPLKEKNCRRNLALLLAQLPPHHDRLLPDIIAAYLHHMPLQNQNFTERLLRDLKAARRRRRLSYVGKSVRNCSEFVRQQDFYQLTLFRRDQDSPLLREFLRDPDSLIKQGRMLKDGNSSTVVCVPGENDSSHWVIKRYNIKNAFHAFKKGLRPSRAWVSWRNAHRLKISDIQTPQAIAMVEKRIGPWRRTCYYVSVWCDAPSAATLIDLQHPQGHPQADGLISLFQQFFNLGIYHGDCKATNFLLMDNKASVIDLDSMGESRWRWAFLRHYAIDRRRFLQNWQHNSPLKNYFDQQLP
ncbi:lipopolysaccharide kinase InaA family protein [Geoalkalibacter subterraneus]|uniref:lipopolysaccharide kinase InaA family protein n=1 Tax=Geoalkalibacter subterraneus TaxID=483547 RepID=UPI00130EAD79|nr:lipopolysaccharide kinase InaA family protein [Geoalkalibacter subterraneus]